MQPAASRPTKSYRITSFLQTLWQTYNNKVMLSILGLGFSAGLPYLLIFSTLSFWFCEAGISRSMIGFFSWIALVFVLKWLWAPALDYIKLPILTKQLGMRRGWLLLSQLIIMVS